jgi:hypothetical protein
MAMRPYLLPDSLLFVILSRTLINADVTFSLTLVGRIRGRAVLADSLASSLMPG